MHRSLVIAVACATLGVAPAVLAYEQGDIIFRGGITTVAPNDDSAAIALPTVPPTVLPSGVSVDSNTALGVSGTWMLRDSWGIELLAATPFEHDIDVTDIDIPAGSTKHLPPTLSLQWYPRGGMNGWQPYLGLGVNYTIFFSEKVSSQLSGALGALLDVESARLSLEDSYGLAAQAGVDIPLNDRWAFNFGIWYIDIGTTAEIDVTTSAGAADTVSFDVDIDPWVYNIGVAYRF
jgi:outer membrane protein